MKHGVPTTLAEADAHQRHHGFAPLLVEVPRNAATDLARKLRLGKRMNAGETEFYARLQAQLLSGEFTKVEFESVKLKVGDGCFYTPDFYCEQGDHEPVIFFEIKGRQKWDDAIVKFKAARERYAVWARFEMWDKVNGQWRQLA